MNELYKLVLYQKRDIQYIPRLFVEFSSWLLTQRHYPITCSEYHYCHLFENEKNTTLRYEQHKLCATIDVVYFYTRYLL